MKLLVRNLDRTTTEEEVRTLFEAYGKVQSCSLVLDGETGISKGFGFVEMPRPGDAKAAAKNLNGIQLGGNRIRVKKAEKKQVAAKKAEPKENNIKAVTQDKDEVEKDAMKNDTDKHRDIWSQ